MGGSSGGKKGGPGDSAVALRDGELRVRSWGWQRRWIISLTIWRQGAFSKNTAHLSASFGAGANTEALRMCLHGSQ